jgi:hypothetical protein
MEMNLPDPKTALANEAFPKGSPRPAYVVPLFLPSMILKTGGGQEEGV